MSVPNLPPMLNAAVLVGATAAVVYMNNNDNGQFPPLSSPQQNSNNNSMSSHAQAEAATRADMQTKAGSTGSASHPTDHRYSNMRPGRGSANVANGPSSSASTAAAAHAAQRGGGEGGGSRGDRPEIQDGRGDRESSNGWFGSIWNLGGGGGDKERDRDRNRPNAGKGRFTESRRAELKEIGEETIRALQQGFYPYRGTDVQLKDKMKESKKNTKFYASDSQLSKWSHSKAPSTKLDTHISILQISTLDAARLLEQVNQNNIGPGPTGVLNFASATKPGGGFRNGAEAQEESIARASTLYPALMSDEAQKFYNLHKTESVENLMAYYSHAMIYSPKITVIRDDDGVWGAPFDIDVLTCAAVNAGEIMKAASEAGPNTSGVTVGIEKEMAERMGRILYLFELRGVKNIVLGTFGTGVFKNDIPTVTRIWAQLLLLPTARFRTSFERVVFAVTGDDTFASFKDGFEAWGEKRARGRPGRG